MELPSAAGFRNRPEIHSPKLEETRDRPQEDALGQVAPWRNMGPPIFHQLGNPWNTSKSIGCKSFKAHFPNNQLPFHGQKKNTFSENPHFFIGKMIVLEVLGWGPTFKPKPSSISRRNICRNGLPSWRSCSGNTWCSCPLCQRKRCRPPKLRRVDEKKLVFSIMA